MLAACSSSAVPYGQEASTTASSVVAPTTAASSSTTTTRPAVPTTSTIPTTTTLPVPEGFMAEGERLGDERLWALVPGNDPEAGRINLIYAGWNWDDFDAFVGLARHTLSWDGHLYLTNVGFPAESLEEATGGTLGLFAIEPFRSRTDWFNVWYTDVEPDNPQAWFLPDSHPFPLDDVVVVTLAVEPESYDPNLTFSFSMPAGFTGPEPPVRPTSGNPFGHVVIRLSRSYPVQRDERPAPRAGSRHVQPGRRVRRPAAWLRRPLRPVELAVVRRGPGRSRGVVG